MTQIGYYSWTVTIVELRVVVVLVVGLVTVEE